MNKTLFFALTIAMLLTACKKDLSTEPSAQNDGASCTNSASFVKDVTVPDNTNFKPGKEFKKTWRIMNTGICTWNEDYHLAFSMNNQMGAPDSVPLKNTPPGKEVSISVEMTAPNEKGSYRADFQLLDPKGVSIPIDNGQYLWVIISVDTP